MVDERPDPLHDSATALVALRAALSRLDGCDLPAPARAALSDAVMALATLEAGQDHTVDVTVFDALMQMAGPVVAPQLVAQMAADLTEARNALDRALQTMDMAEIRAQTHVLIALAGSAGAHGVEQGARLLNHAAHDNDTARIAALQQGLLQGLDALIGFVRQARAAKSP